MMRSLRSTDPFGLAVASSRGRHAPSRCRRPCLSSVSTSLRAACGSSAAGVKDSGVGTEGPRYAMREMTEERLITASLS